MLGRQPALGLLEAESLFGSLKIRPIGLNSALLDVPIQDIPFSRLGGSTRAAKVLTRLPYLDWNKIEEYLVTELPKHTCCLPEGKIRLGVSAYGLQVNLRRLNATGLTLKKVVKADGRSVRVVPNKELELNTAQVLHNQLTGPTGMELLLIRDGNETVLAQTTAVQDIDAYAARDQARPARDARVGMLPPKLAQIIVNLATGSTPRDPSFTILDPFCGTGVILQEADLMNYGIKGTDMEERMVDYSHRNLVWLSQLAHSNLHGLDPDQIMHHLSVADATNHQWNADFNAIACETYLGRPFSAEPKPEVLDEVMNDVDTIHRKFLQNVARQTDVGFRMCIAVPAWNTTTGFKHLKVLDSLEELGYNRVKFAHVRTRDLIYYRDKQVVGRELVTLIRK